jgi:hypothetical protein
MSMFALKSASTVFTAPYNNITEKKKADLDKLALEIIHAQAVVDQYTAIVTALTEKANKFQAGLGAANARKTTALSDLNFTQSLVSMANNLMAISKTDNQTIDQAGKLTNDLALNVKDMIAKLIYTVDIINKLNNATVRQKALNPLISDDLINRLTQAGTDANNAIALCLVALKSTFTAQSSTSESIATTVLELEITNELLIKLSSVHLENALKNGFKKALAFKERQEYLINMSDRDQVFVLLSKAVKTAIAQKTIDIDIMSRVVIEYEKLLNKQSDELKALAPMLIATLRTVHVPNNIILAGANEPLSLLTLMEQRYENSVDDYDDALAANNETTKQLTIAQQKLSSAQIELKSLQSGLSAANAAAFAS